jgi:A/G-specific adenine glycosylase
MLGGGMAPMARYNCRMKSHRNLPSAAWQKSLRCRLLKWFHRHKRALPWRESRDPYRVWISEVMLQQTQVATVIPYFDRFLQRFPTIKALAEADEADVLRLWDGLGYYRRARQLHAAARVIVADHRGVFPTDFASIRALPGIGRYTAGAIASIAFDRPTPIVEANTARLYSRLLLFRGDPSSKAGQDQLWHFAEAILPEVGSSDVNQALMELGSLVCTPRHPRCDKCPLRSLCPTHSRQLQSEIPAAKVSKSYESVHEIVVVIRNQRKVLLRQSRTGERWAGLWDFPRFPMPTPCNAQHQARLITEVRELTGLTVRPGQRLTVFKHSVTRFRITLECHEAERLSGRLKHLSGIPLKWVAPEELSEFPLNQTARKLARLIQAGSLSTGRSSATMLKPPLARNSTL